MSLAGHRVKHEGTILILRKLPQMLLIGLLSSLAGTAFSAVITSTTSQAIHGIGASGGWWPNDLYLFPESSQEEIARLLFDSDTGLGLTDYRYNLGGGGVGVTTFARAPETPYVSDGVYNFSADPQGTYFLRAGAQYEVPIITLFVNSAPTTMTSNSQNCGGTLITDRIPAYAQYLTDVISYWYSQNITFSYVSVMNEPDDSFGSCSQEGMQVTPSQRAQVVNTVATALTNASLPTKVIADESSSVSNFAAAPSWLPDVKQGNIAGIAHHDYGFGTDSQLTSLGATARNLSGGVYSWFTEICCWVESDSSAASDPLATLTYGSSYDPTMVSALRMGNLIWQSLTQAEDAHWDFWTALSSEYGSCTPATNTSCAYERNYDGWDDGLIYYDPDYATNDNYNFTLSKRFPVLKHFTQAIPIGAVRVNVSSVETNWRVLAFNSPSTSQLFSVVAMNAQNITSTLTLSGSGLGAPSEAYMTDPSSDYTSVQLSVANGSLVIDAPALSIYTIFF
ncbi:glycoside hydrolase family 30 protein [Neolentinus lepideus HHB14362 ss-1]|uniref:Glycoside hydrolase family 30 protein n=1 Tax=Neolentinus lepideus HHB14362 ss-1 TaxID=1314782 RepID=A0A165VGY4_9AGAM|nr:glycoside hydrolase family 30 protein [Neolentinus lepideus HHB14362 ss-1]